MDELILGSDDIDIYATVGEPEKVEPATPIRAAPPKHDARGYIAAVGAVALATFVAYALFGRHELADVVMMYLLAIVGVSMRFGFRASVLAACSVCSRSTFFSSSRTSLSAFPTCGTSSLSRSCCSWAS